MILSHIEYEQKLPAGASAAVVSTRFKAKRLLLALAIDRLDGEGPNEARERDFIRLALQRVAGRCRYHQIYIDTVAHAVVSLHQILNVAQDADAALILCRDERVRREVWRLLNVRSNGSA